MVTGGWDDNSGGGDVIPYTELYNPTTGIWITIGSLTTGRQEHTATLLPNGQVLVTGGSTYSGSPLSSAELFDPATGTWVGTNSLNTPRWGQAATLLPNGQLVVMGGYGDATEDATASVELFNTGLG